MLERRGLLFAASAEFALCLGAGAFAGAVLDAAGAVLPVLGAAALAYEAPAAGLVGALADRGFLRDVVVQLQVGDGVDRGAAVSEVADADTEDVQCGVQRVLQLP